MNNQDISILSTLCTSYEQTHVYADFVIHVGMPEILLLDARIPHPHASEFLHRAKNKRENLLQTDKLSVMCHSTKRVQIKNGKNKEGSIFMRHWCDLSGLIHRDCRPGKNTNAQFVSLTDSGASFLPATRDAQHQNNHKK